MFLAPCKPKTTVLTRFFFRLIAKITVFIGFLPRDEPPSKNTSIYAGFSVLQDVVSIYGKHRNTVFLRCFCFPTTDKKVQQWLKNGHFGACVRPSWPILTHLGAMLAHLGAMLARLGALAHLGAIGPSWGYAGPSWGASWASLGLCWPNLGPVWGLCWATWTHLDPS